MAGCGITVSSCPCNALENLKLCSFCDRCLYCTWHNEHHGAEVWEDGSHFGSQISLGLLGFRTLSIIVHQHRTSDWEEKAQWLAGSLQFVWVLEQVQFQNLSFIKYKNVVRVHKPSNAECNIPLCEPCRRKVLSAMEPKTSFLSYKLAPLVSLLR